MEMAVILPLLAILASAIITAGPYVRIAIATQQAAYDCAISAAQSLNAEQGYMQGAVAVRQSFETFGLNIGNSTTRVFGNWNRGSNVMCEVSYHVPLGNLPLTQILAMPSTVKYSVTLPAQYFKSKWK